MPRVTLGTPARDALDPVSTVTAITPVRNGAALIGRTVSSIVNQSAVRSGRVQLQYLLCDGASTDDTVGVATRAAGDVDLEVISEPDQGMYDALAKGLRRADGDLVFYLNAGDLLFPGALDVVLDIAEQREVRWLTGYGAIVNAEGVVVSMSLPFRYRRRLLRTNAYGSILPTLQQESTFWRAELSANIDLDALATYRLAGDHYLWSTFSAVEEPTIVKALLGGFTYHDSHLSSDRVGYRTEVARHANRVGARDLGAAVFDSVVWRSPDRVKKALNRGHLRIYDKASSTWK
jgi:glycosyltransferase involved in cell wall biosynthesis